MDGPKFYSAHQQPGQDIGYDEDGKDFFALLFVTITLCTRSVQSRTYQNDGVSILFQFDDAYVQYQELVPVQAFLFRRVHTVEKK